MEVMTWDCALSSQAPPHLLSGPRPILPGGCRRRCWFRSTTWPDATALLQRTGDPAGWEVTQAQKLGQNYVALPYSQLGQAPPN